MAGLAATYVDADTFTVTDDLTESFIPGRRVKLDCDTDGIKYGTVLSSAYTTLTTVNLTTGSDAITANLTEAWFGILGADDNTQSMPEHSHDGNEGSGGALVATDLPAIDKIEEGNSSVEVVDAGTGAVTVTVDGNSEVDVTDSGLRLGGANSRAAAILDEDDMTSDSATALATQQSIKAYADAIRENYAGVNLLDNPALNVAQTMYPTPPQNTSGYRVFDRWFGDSSGAVGYSLKQDTVQPDIGDTGYTGIIPEDVGVYGINFDTDTATGTVNATDYGIFGQKIPQSKLLPLILNSSTFSFWLRPSVAATYCVVMRNGGWSAGVPGAGTYDYVMDTFTVTTINEWQLITINFPALDVTTNPTNWGLGSQSGAASTAADDQDAASALGLELFICLFAGSTYNGGTSDGTWRTGDYYASSSQGNGSVSTGNFRINQPKLEIGDVRTQFQMPDYHREHANCLRYFERLRATAVGDVYCFGETLTATTSRFFLPFTHKHKVPSIGSLVATASNFNVEVAGSNYAVSAFDSYTWMKTGVEIRVTHATVGASVNFVASLKDNGSGTTFFDIDAEL